MKIAVDCRYLGMSGIGRVCRGIIENLDYSINTYYLIGNENELSGYSQAVIIGDDTKPYSKTGLLKFSKKRVNGECDCLVIPNFLIPLGIKVPVHTVMHDLIFLDLKITTRNFADRLIKKYLLKRCIKKSKTVACVSAFTLSRCIHYYGKRADKCYVNYQGLSRSLSAFCAEHRQPAAKRGQIVYVGNVKPHKGLATLLSAFEKTQGLTLKIIGERDNFITGLKLDEKAYDKVQFTGKISDEELFEEVRCSKYLVLPSQYEGFGIPPLEALCLGTTPIVSDIEVFREVYAGLPVIFFSDEADLAAKMQTDCPATDAFAAVTQRYNYKNFVEGILQRLK